jgi:hypothetical protein
MTFFICSDVDNNAVLFVCLTHTQHMQDEQLGFIVSSVVQALLQCRLRFVYAKCLSLTQERKCALLV